MRITIQNIKLIENIKKCVQFYTIFCFKLYYNSKLKFIKSLKNGLLIKRPVFPLKL